MGSPHRGPRQQASFRLRGGKEVRVPHSGKKRRKEEPKKRDRLLFGQEVRKATLSFMVEGVKQKKGRRSGQKPCTVKF